MTIRPTMALLAITSIGVYLTVPETRHVLPMMTIAVVTAIVFMATESKPSVVAAALIATGILVTGMHDSAGHRAAMARVIGCFGVLLAEPIARRLVEHRQEHRYQRGHAHPALLLSVHCAVVAISSRGLLRTDATEAEVAVALTLVAATTALVVAALA